MLRYCLPVLALVLLSACRHDPVADREGLPLKTDTVASVLLDVGGASVQGMAWLAEDSVRYPAVGGTLHPTAMLIRDVWSSGAMQHVAHGLRVRGWNAIAYDHRGTWASLGTFTLDRLRTDVEWAVAGLRADWALSTWGVARDRITLVGHFWGGGAALAAAARDPAIRCVVGLAPLNIGAKGRLAGKSTAYLDATVAEVKAWGRTANLGDPLNVRLGTTPELFVEELIARAAEFDVTLLAPLLAGRPVLLVGTTTMELDNDSAMHQAPMRDALVKAGAIVTDTIMNVRHSDFATLETELVGIVKAWLLREHCGG